MKKFILLTGFLFCLVLLSNSQVVIQKTFDLNDHKDMLGRLFDGDDFNEYGEVLWAPQTFAEQLNANPSDDGWLHTRLDTILYYDSYNISKAVAVFETVHYINGMVNDCDACGVQISIAVFDRLVDGNWTIERFAKHHSSLGGGGYGGEIGLAQFGENQWCLTLEMSWTGQGVYGEYLSLLNLEDLEKVFNLTIHEDNMGVLGEESERAYSFDKAIQLLPTVETVTGWWEFDLVTQGTEPDHDVERAVPSNFVQRYAYDWETGTYMKVCP